MRQHFYYWLCHSVSRFVSKMWRQSIQVPPDVPPLDVAVLRPGEQLSASLPYPAEEEKSEYKYFLLRLPPEGCDGLRVTPVEVRLPDWVLASSVVKPTNLVRMSHSKISLSMWEAIEIKKQWKLKSSLYCTVLYCTVLFWPGRCCRPLRGCCSPSHWTGCRSLGWGRSTRLYKYFFDFQKEKI